MSTKAAVVVTVSNFESEITAYLKAGFPGLYIRTYEEARVERVIKKAASHEKLKRSVFVWSVTRGWVQMVDQGGRTLDIKDPKAALEALLPGPDGQTKLGEEGVFVLRDFHFFMQGPGIIRLFRDLMVTAKQRGQTVIIVSPVSSIPPELEKEFTLLEFDLPSRGELGDILDVIVESAGGEKHAKVEDRASLLEAARGQTASEAENTFALALVKHQSLGAEALKTVQREKANIIRKTGIMEFYNADVSMDDIGGLKSVKQWISQRRRLLTDAALDYGFDRQAVRVLVVGVPGVGKSLIAKAIASSYNKPLIRFDVGRVFGSLVGESERNIRHALSIAEACAPDVLWFDELEKGFAGMITGSQSDGGVGARVLGTLLTWWQECLAPVSIVATANDVSALPGALLRRFDEIFFADLPDQTARAEITTIHLRKRKRDAEKFDISKIAMMSDQFSGAEIEKAVLGGMIEAFNEDREVTTADILRAIDASPPLAQVQPTAISEVREWATKNRARKADEIVLESPRPARRVNVR